MGIEAIVLPNQGFIEFQENLIKSKYLAREGNQITGKLYAKYKFNIIILPLHDIGNSFVELGWPRTIIIFCTRRLMDVQ